MSKLTITIDHDESPHNCHHRITIEYINLCSLEDALEALTTALNCAGFNYPNHVLTYEAPENGNDSDS